MWMWDNSSIDGESCDASDCVDDFDTDTVLEMYHYANGTFMELNGYMDDAIREYQDAISFNPEDGYYHYTLGVALLKNGQYNEAFKELSEALMLNPDNYEARCALADVHNEVGQNLGLEGRVEEAVAEFREAIAIDPAFPEYHYRLGMALIDAGHRAATAGNAKSVATSPAIFRDAITELRKTIVMDPDNAEARLNLGMALAMNGSERALDEGIMMLSKILDADPFNDEARHCLNYARGKKSKVSEYC